MGLDHEMSHEGSNGGDVEMHHNEHHSHIDEEIKKHLAEAERNKQLNA